MAPPGRIYYSPRAKRFYQEGRRGAVSREKAAGSLTFDPESGKFFDQRDRPVPEWALGAAEVRIHRFKAYDVKGRPFVTSEFRDRRRDITTLEGSPLRSNQQAVVRTTITTPDGKVHISYSSGKLGQRVNQADLDAKANRKARGQLWGKDYDMSYRQIRGATVTRQYLVRTVTVR